MFSVVDLLKFESVERDAKTFAEMHQVLHMVLEEVTRENIVDLTSPVNSFSMHTRVQ